MGFQKTATSIYLKWSPAQREVFNQVEKRLCRAYPGNIYGCGRQNAEGEIIEMLSFENGRAYTHAEEMYQSAGIRLATEQEYDSAHELQ